MNIACPDPTAQPRHASRCSRHSDDHGAGFCPSCLRERLKMLDHSSSSRRPTTINQLLKTSDPTPERRRWKSFSASSSNNESLGPFLKPRRKSCDVRAEDVIGPNNNNDLIFEEDFGDSPDDLSDEVMSESGMSSSEIVEEEVVISGMGSLKPQKTSFGRLRFAASNFGKKWRNWRRKKKDKKQSNGEKLATLSEVADYRFGRRSCDTHPSLSLDGWRYLFEEPRASQNEHLIRSFIGLEDPSYVHGSRSDNHVPGGSVQTKEYYVVSSRRRRSLDKSNGAIMNDEIDGPSNLPHRFHLSMEGQGHSRKSRKWSWRIWGSGDNKSALQSVSHGNGNGDRFKGSFAKTNRSVSYPPNHLDNGLLRFYLTPIRTSRKRGLPDKIKPNNLRKNALSLC